MRWILLFVVLAVGLFAQTQQARIKSPQEIRQELNDAQKAYKKALEEFNPWYTGPLLTPSASMMPPGYANAQPYLFIIDSYATFDANRESHSNPSSKVTLNPSLSAQFGVTETMDIALFMQALGNFQFESSGGGFGDMSITVGWPITRQSLFIPGIKFTITEIFPTGRYQSLNHNGLGLSATGAGAWTTRFGLAISKLIFWWAKHPTNFRLFFGYGLSTPVSVKGFNAYGGGFDTRGKVKPGDSFQADLGIEVSLTQHWVIATDLVYTYQNRTTFSGNPGVTARTGGVPATVGGPYSDNLSLAPAIEYNFNPNLGMLVGTQFSVYGKNSSNFASAIASVTWTFGPL